ncbi:hypothetical protein HHK36_015158 [Tetracentron sinense]|uniref:WAT1-related protein n=1 Tax=Tetracentron sinense TaxID=13715 RepID=A0A834Z6P1_TETSI|nr:hypothetical protein HHK36_015158 [Tetracentron sinense]
MGVWSCFGDVVPFTGMVMVECTYVGLNTIFKAAMSRGMSQFVFIVYSNALASLILLPSSFFFHRAASRPPLTFSLLCKIFLLSILGCLVKFLGYTGINYSSPTLSSAIGNLVPAFTFILAIIFRMEKLDLKNSSGQSKSMGTIVSISGAFIVTLYKGRPILLTPSPSNSSHQLLLSEQSNWVIGGLFLTAENFLFPILFVFKASIIKEYPAELIIVFFYSLFVAIQSAIVTLIAETNPSAWRVRSDMELFAIVYSGVMGCLLCTTIHIWGLRLKGPVYVAMFKPFTIVIAVVMGVMFLGDTLHLGSVVGAIIISLGFYAVLWGKVKEEKMEKESGIGSLESSSQKAPLLPSNKNEEI